MNSLYLMEIKYQIELTHITEEVIQYLHKQMDAFQIC